MLSENISIEAVCESSILIRFSDQIDSDLPLFINQVAEIIYAQYSDSIMNLTPSYTTLLVDYLPYRTTEHEILHGIGEVVFHADKRRIEHKANIVALPIYYGDDVAPDLVSFISEKSMSLEKLVQLHTEPEYTICAIGFTPGFAFLSGLNSVLQMPRQSTPRLKVMPGSVGIGGDQTAVYPSSSPGGWNIIGNCPIPLFDPNSEQLSPFRVGDKVKFSSISKKEYLNLGGLLWDI